MTAEETKEKTRHNCTSLRRAKTTFQASTVIFERGNKLDLFCWHRKMSYVMITIKQSPIVPLILYFLLLLLMESQE